MKPKIVLFASGSGSNVENIISYFNTKEVAIACVLTNRKNAGVVKRCQRLNVPLLYFNKNAFDEDVVLQALRGIKPDLIVLAGFLVKIPESIIKSFPNKIINIHPALLPKYGGKGMYGNHVHEAVLNNNEEETGITIHYVNEHYDEGAIIFQAKVKLSPEDSAADIAQKVHQLEYDHYPQIIDNLLKQNG